MSDGGIQIAAAFGYSTNELARKVLVRPDWLTRLRDARSERDHQVRSVIYQRSSQKSPCPDLPADLTDILKRIAQGESRPFGEWSFANDKIVNAIHAWNEAVDRAWYHGLGLGDDKPRTPKDFQTGSR